MNEPASSSANATSTMLNPTDLRSVRDAVLDTSGTIAIAGAGTAADWGGRLAPVDAVLDTTGLTGVIAHNPGDMTVSVRAGMPLRALAAELAPHGQHVSLDAARVAAGATVGGLVATGDAGPAALVYGSLRDLVIGMTVVLADGTVARTGGHVIKNVAGYDLAKLMHGSYGTLAAIAEVVLRLHPVPRASATIALSCTLDEAVGHAAAVLGGPYEPAALEWTSAGALLVRVEGSPEAIDARVERVRGALGAGHRAQPWDEHAALVRGTGAVLRIGTRPSRLAPLLGSLPGVTAVTAGLGTGVATVSLDPDGVAEAHALVHAAGGTSMLRSRPADADVPAWGPAPSAAGVLRAVKTALDPEGRFGPGRFEEWR